MARSARVLSFRTDSVLEYVVNLAQHIPPPPGCVVADPEGSAVRYTQQTTAYALNVLLTPARSRPNLRLVVHDGNGGYLPKRTKE